MKKMTKNGVRWWVRGILFVLAVGLMVGGSQALWMLKIIPAFSPLTALSASLAHRAWYATLVWTVPALLTLALGLWKGRFFCHTICPLGTLYATASLKSAKKKILPVRLNGFIFWTIFFASSVGLPMWLFLDPLSTFSRLGVATNWAVWIPAAMVPLMLLLGLFQPLIWCTHLCPLGYLLESVRIRKVTPQKLCQTRRELLTGALIGVPLALLLKNKVRAAKKPLLPPGAVSLDNFAATCERCYACVRACPSQIIKIRQTGDGIAELALPELTFDQGTGVYCRETCNVCSQVCPTGAIRPISVEAKRLRKIGEARVIRDACLCWNDKEVCMLCASYCPYGAIEAHYGDGNGRGARIAKPIVNPHKCRGCGACQAVCPAVRMGKAIVIEPLVRQEVIDEKYRD
jgi:ferredoxin